MTIQLPTISEVAYRAEYPGEDGNPYRMALGQIDRAIGELKRYRAEMQEMSAHRHEYSEDDYCIHCGADGRA